HLHRRVRAGGDRGRPPARGGRADRQSRSGAGPVSEPVKGDAGGERGPAQRQARLQVIGLEVRLDQSGTDVVGDVSFAVSAGEVLGLVGESGSGKTTVALAL